MKNFVLTIFYGLGSVSSILLLLVISTNETTAQDVQTIRKAQPFRIKGTLSAGMWFYSMNGISTRRQPFSWYLTGSPVVSVYGMTFPFTLTVSDQNRQFAQPFNRYGVSPYYKWFTLHAGYRNVKFSDFTLAGVTMLGGGFEMNPGKFRLGVMVGEINRAVSEDTSSGDPLRVNRFPVFKRMGYAVKVGVGSRTNYVDLLFFKGRDDPNSITRPVRSTRITPADNAVAGMKTHFTVLKKLTFDADLALSVFTSNLYLAPLAKTNANYELLNSIKGIVDVNESSGLYKAGRASLTYGFGVGSVAAQYERIDQNFQSLGAFFFNNDNEQWTVSPSFSVFQNKLTISGAYGIAHDNLTSNKYATTFRTIGSLNVGVQLSDKLMLGANLSNFGTSQNRGVGDFFNDTTAINIINGGYGFTASYNDPNEYRVVSINLSGGYQDANDQNRFTRNLTAVQSLYGNLSYTYSLLESQTSLMASFAYNDTKAPTQTVRTLGPSVSVSRAFLAKKLHVSANGSYFLRQTNEQADGSTLSLIGSAAYSLHKHTFTLSGNVLSNQSNTKLSPSFTELRTNVLYGYSF